MPDIGMTPNTDTAPGRLREPISSVEVIAESAIARIEIITEREAATAYITTEDGEKLRSCIMTNATVKIVELIINHEDPNRIIVLTY
jgi:hypothetical protein